MGPCKGQLNIFKGIQVQLKYREHPLSLPLLSDQKVAEKKVLSVGISQAVNPSI